SPARSVIWTASAAFSHANAAADALWSSWLFSHHGTDGSDGDGSNAGWSSDAWNAWIWRSDRAAVPASHRRSSAGHCFLGPVVAQGVPIHNAAWSCAGLRGWI